MRKPAFSICKNKGADQLCNNRAADQRLCFRYVDILIPLLSKPVANLLWLYSLVCVRPGQKSRGFQLDQGSNTKIATCAVD